jgi:hypothetical protein
MRLSRSGIVTQLLTQAVHAPGDHRLDGPDGAAERLGRVRLGQVLVVAEDDRGALPRAQVMSAESTRSRSSTS